MSNSLKKSPQLTFSVADLGPLLRVAGIDVPKGDLEPLARALESHIADTRILLDADLGAHPPAVGARWHV